MIVDHIGIAVPDINKGISFWEKTFGYGKATDIIENTRQKVLVVFMKKKESSLIKLIQPVDENSPIYAFARRGGGLHHLCFRTDDMKDGVSHLEENDCRLIVPAQPGEAFGNNDISFLLSKFNLNIELIDQDFKEGWIPD